MITGFKTNCNVQVQTRCNTYPDCQINRSTMLNTVFGDYASDTNKSFHCYYDPSLGPKPVRSIIQWREFDSEAAE